MATKKKTPNGYFTTDGAEYVNLEVGKSSPNRIGQVTGMVYSSREGEEFEFAEVKFRDFNERIKFNREEAKNAPYLTFSPKGLNKKEVEFLKAIEKDYFAGADINMDMLKSGLAAIKFKQGSKDANGILEAWSYWQSIPRPINRQSYKHPVKLSSLITMAQQDRGAYISVRDEEGNIASGYCKLIGADSEQAAIKKLGMFQGFGLFFEVAVGENFYAKYNTIIGSRYIAKVENDIPQLQPVKEMKKGGALSKEEAIKLAKAEGVDFDKDFLAQSFGEFLADLAKRCGYRKPKNANGSTGRYFFSHLEKIVDKENKKLPKIHATYNEYGYQIWDSQNNMKYHAGNSPNDSQVEVGLDEALSLEKIKEYAERTGREIAETEKLHFIGADYEKPERDVFEKGGQVNDGLPCVIIVHKNRLKGRFGFVQGVSDDKNTAQIKVAGKVYSLDIEDFAVAGTEVSFAGNKKYDKGMVLSFDYKKENVEIVVSDGKHIQVKAMLIGKVIGEKEGLLKSIEQGKFVDGDNSEAKVVVLGQ